MGICGMHPGAILYEVLKYSTCDMNYKIMLVKFSKEG